MIYSIGALVHISKCAFTQHMCWNYIGIISEFQIPMSQSSKSEATLVLDEEMNETPTRSGSTSSSSHTPCLPPPRFPKWLACIKVKSVNFQQGLDEQLVDGGIPSHLMCSICLGLPRRASTLEGCRHLFRECCIKEHFMLRSEPQAPWSTVKGAPCPSCMQGFRIGEILTWPVAMVGPAPLPRAGRSIP